MKFHYESYYFISSIHIFSFFHSIIHSHDIDLQPDAPVSTAERMNHKSAASHDARTREYPPGTVGAMSKQLFVNTQVNKSKSINKIVWLSVSLIRGCPVNMNS